jgi:hypothetical protein
VLNRRSTLRFTLEDSTGAYIPTPGESCIYIENGTSQFGGSIQSIEITATAGGAWPALTIDVECVDNYALADATAIAPNPNNLSPAPTFASVPGESVKTFLTRLIAEGDPSLADKGVTLSPDQPDGPPMPAHVTDADGKESWTWSAVPASTILNDLAVEFNLNIEIDAYRVLLAICPVATAPPTLAWLTAEGGYKQSPSDAKVFFGFANLACLASPPTNVACTAVAGGAMSVGVQNSQYGLFFTSVDVNGDESDPEPFYVDDGGYAGSRGRFPSWFPTCDVSAGIQTVRGTFTKGAGAVTTRVYLMTWYYGPRFEQMLETAGTSVDFTLGPPFGTPVSSGNITPGATVPTFPGGYGHDYSCAAIMASGTTALQMNPYAIGPSECYQRPVMMRCDAVPLASGYYWVRRDWFGPWEWRWQTVDPWCIDTLDVIPSGAVAINGWTNPKGGAAPFTITDAEANCETITLVRYDDEFDLVTSRLNR